MNCKLIPLLLAAAPALVLIRDSAAQKGSDPTAPSAPAAGSAVTPGVGIRPDSGNAWFPVTERDLGTRFNHEDAVGTFEFENPRSEPVVWRHLAGSCQCSKAVIRVEDRRYELNKGATGSQLMRVTNGPGGEQRETVTQIEIAPGESGEVEVHMEMTGVTGPRNASIDIHTSDPELPMIKLKWVCTGAKMFVKSPEDVNLNQMAWNEERDFTVTVISPVAKDFNITGMDEPDASFQVSYDKELKDGIARWTIRGKYAPKSADAIGGGVLKFHTDVEGEPSFMVRVSALVQLPLEVKPGTFLSLGMIRRGKTKTEKVVFQPNDDSNLEAVAVRFDKLTVDPRFVHAKTTKDGKNLVVEIEVAADAPAGLLRGDLLVDLNHPVVKSKKILFNGYVR